MQQPYLTVLIFNRPFRENEYLVRDVLTPYKEDADVFVWPSSKDKDYTEVIFLDSSVKASLQALFPNVCIANTSDETSFYSFDVKVTEESLITTLKRTFHVTKNNITDIKERKRK